MLDSVYFDCSGFEGDVHFELVVDLAVAAAVVLLVVVAVALLVVELVPDSEEPGVSTAGFC